MKRSNPFERRSLGTRDKKTATTISGARDPKAASRESPYGIHKPRNKRSLKPQRDARARVAAAADKRSEARDRAQKSAEKTPAPKLASSERKHLRGLAHKLTPLVQVGHGGVTDAVIGATRSALLDHELVKVRLHEPEDKQAMALDLATRTLSALCGLVGHTVILYKPHPHAPQISLT